MKNTRVKPGFRAALKDNGVLEMTVYEEIGADWFGTGVTAKSFKQQIDAAGPFNRIAVRINSPGGDAFEGCAIFNLLRAQKKPVDVAIDGLAASAASIIAMAGDTITMGHNAMMMIHDAWSICIGNDEDMRKMADTLAKVSESIAQTYVDRTGKSMDDVKVLMDAETWMSAEECLAGGFATAIAKDDSAGAMALASSFKSLAKLKNVPEQLKAVKNEMACQCYCEACQMQNCEDCTMQGCVDPNCIDCPMQSSENASATVEVPVEAIVTPVIESNISQYEARLQMLRCS